MLWSNVDHHSIEYDLSHKVGVNMKRDVANHVAVVGVLFVVVLVFNGGSINVMLVVVLVFNGGNVGLFLW